MKAVEEYRLVGVHCVSCKRILEKEVSKIRGVVRVDVDPNTGIMRLELTDDADRSSIVKAIRNVGYDVVLERLILKSPSLRDGMGKKLEAKLQRMPGVVEARVFEAGKIIRIELDPLETNPKKIIEKIKELGITAYPIGREEKKESMRIPLILSLIAVTFYSVGALLSMVIPEYLGGIIGSLVAFKEFYLPALKALRRGYLIMDTLLMLGTGAAIALTLYGLVFHGPIFIDAIVFITLFVIAGRSIEEKLRRRAEKLLEKAKNVLPDKARVERGEGPSIISENMVKAGETVIVNVGEVIPVDGRISSGSGEVDESVVTGESKPRNVSVGDLVIAGSTLVRGSLKITALRTGKYRLVARALDAAREASLYKPKLQRLADKIVAVFVPVVIIIAMIAMIGHTVMGSGLLSGALAAATVLVVACPCALGIAIPTALAASVARAYKMGAILKRPDVLESLSKIKIIAFDKTGTLTRGQPLIVDVKNINGDAIKALKLAAGVESRSNHPLARAIISFYYSQYNDGEPPQPEDIDEVPGLGVIGVIDGRSIAIGGEKLLAEMGINTPNINVKGTSRVYVIIDGDLALILGVDDAPKPEARDVIMRLHSMGIETFILSGDSKDAVVNLARRLGIPEENALSRLDPLEKSKIIARLSGRGAIAYVGDGVNDGPSLAEADVGIAVNEALDVAKQAGDIVLAKNNLNIIINLIKLSKTAMKTIRLNLIWALAYNAVLIPIAAGALESLGISISPALAALAMSLSSITVTTNSARILRLNAN